MRASPPNRRSRPKMLVTGEAGFRGADAAAIAPFVAAGVLAFAAFTALIGFGWTDDPTPPAARPAIVAQPAPLQIAPAPTPAAEPVVVALARPLPAPPQAKPKRPPRAVVAASLPPPARIEPRRAPTGAPPMLAIVIDDLGFDPRRTERLAAMPGPMTFAFLPYAKGVPAQSRLTRAAGHTVLLHMPMQPRGPQNPGPYALRVADDAEAVRMKLRAAFDAVPGAVGLNNHMGSRITASPAHMRVVADVARARDMLFLDSRTHPSAIAAEAAAERGAAWAARDVFIDDDAARAAIDAQLRAAERLAHRRGYAVAIGHPYDTTIAALRAFLPAARRRGVKLVSIEKIAELNRFGPRPAVAQAALR